MSCERLFTVGELARQCGITVRTLQFYDRSGLLSPSRYSDGGRRLYGMDDLSRLQQLLFYKGFGFSLDEIRDRLMVINSAQDFAEVLNKQRKIVEKQIEYLTETVKLMNIAISEISQNENVTMDVVIAILNATRQGKFFSYVIKHFKQEEIKTLLSVAGSHIGTDLPGDIFITLLKRLKELHGRKADPNGPEGQKLAGDWWDMVMTLTGGDQELISTILTAGNDMGSWPEEVGDVNLAIQELLKPALMSFFSHKGITVLPGTWGAAG